MRALKRIGWFAFAACAAGMSVQAQTSMPVVPTLPAPPGSNAVAPIPLPPGMEGIVGKKPEEEKKPVAASLAPPMPGSADRVAAPVTAPAIPGATTPPVTTTTAATPPSATAPAIPGAVPPLPAPTNLAAGVPPLPLPPGSINAPSPDMVAVEKAKEKQAIDAAADKEAAMVPLPPSFTEQLKASPTGIVLPPAPKFPKVHEHLVERPHTWDTKLKPVVKPRKISFNYKRQIMPGTIYMKQYDRENTHLPPSVTTEDYDRWFLESVAANDLNATRSFLDSGRDVNMVNAEGDTALVMALRYGAYDTARLLIARGASPAMAGPSGRTAGMMAQPGTW